MILVPDVFQLLADPTRRELLGALRGGERSVKELVGVSRISQPGVSKQLRLLREAGMVAVRREGRQRMYSLRGVPLKEVSDWLKFYERFWEDSIAQMDALLVEERSQVKRRRT